MNVYVTKYALSLGIIERELVSEKGTMAEVKWPGGMNGVFYLHGKDWHRTRVEAVAHAEKMRLKKVASLRKQIAAMEKLKW